MKGPIRAMLNDAKAMGPKAFLFFAGFFLASLAFVFLLLELLKEPWFRTILPFIWTPLAIAGILWGAFRNLHKKS